MVYEGEEAFEHLKNRVSHSGQASDPPSTSFNRATKFNELSGLELYSPCC